MRVNTVATPVVVVVVGGGSGGGGGGGDHDAFLRQCFLLWSLLLLSFSVSLL